MDVTLVKYPKTPHLPWSQGVASDDDVLRWTLSFIGQRVVVTEKMDGENTTIYWNGGYHARSLNKGYHPSRSYVGKLAGELHGMLPEGMIICGENLYAKHSIHYHHLPDYFLVFSIWDQDECLPWDETVFYCNVLGLSVVPVLYDDIWDYAKIRSLYKPVSENGDEAEGYVVRLADEFSRSDFGQSIAKYVRPNHVQTSKHWMFDGLVKNELGG